MYMNENNPDVKSMAIKRVLTKIERGERLNGNERMLYLQSKFPRRIK